MELTLLYKYIKVIDAVSVQILLQQLLVTSSDVITLPT